jgi:hypothetical protein
MIGGGNTTQQSKHREGVRGLFAFIGEKPIEVVAVHKVVIVQHMMNHVVFNQLAS